MTGPAEGVDGSDRGHKNSYQGAGCSYHNRTVEGEMKCVLPAN